MTRIETGYTIEPAQPQDLWQIIDIRTGNWLGPEHLMPDHGMTHEWMLGQVEQAMRPEALHTKLKSIRDARYGRGDRHWSVAVAHARSGAREILGYAEVALPKVGNQPQAAELASLHLREGCRGLGVGSVLLANAIDRITDPSVLPQIPSVFLGVVAGNSGARRFYERYDFIDAGPDERYEGWHMRRMARKLEQSNIRRAA